MSRSYDIAKTIQHIEERLDELEGELLDKLGEMKEAMEEEGEVWEGSTWQSYRKNLYEKIYGEEEEEEEEEED